MAELVDALDLKSSDHCGRAGSSPAPGTCPAHNYVRVFFIIKNILLFHKSLNNFLNLQSLLI